VNDSIKKLIWVYFFLLVLEGALRKWVVPGLAEPLLIVRDPVAILIYLAALGSGLFPWRAAVLGLVGFAMASLAFAVVAGVPVVVALYGLRINYLHVPLIFVMGSVLTREDVLRIGRWVLILSVPITLLMLMQYRAGEGSWLNRGVGGEADGQLAGALGKTRPPGPFSFITGPVCWFGLATAYAIYGWMNREVYGRLLILAATVAIVVAIPVSISRSLLLSVVVVLAFGVVALARDLRKAGAVAVPIVVVAVVLSSINGGELTSAFASRWEASTTELGGVKGSIFQRAIGDYTAAFDLIAEAPLTGHGIGLGSNVGARFSSGQATFLLAEAEWPKIVLELGPILGFAFILYRCWLTFHVVMAGWRRMLAKRDALGWLLAGAAFLWVLSGQWAPPTILGFAVFGAGLALAAANEEEPADNDEEDADGTTDADLDENAEGDPVHE
jgi:hypothetical protein